MRFIQSFWSVPILTNENNKSAGWLNIEMMLMSWALSCYSIKKYHNNITLYTDQIGKKVLIDILNLPYSDFNTKLESIEHLNYKLWAYGKILTYKDQKKPFIHVDGDIFIWEAFTKDFLSKDIFAQNVEITQEIYSDSFSKIINSTLTIPANISVKKKETEKIRVSNTGIFGGNDIEFIQEYSKLCIDFCETNKLLISKSQFNHLNHFYEQFFLYLLVNKKRNQIDYLFDHVSEDFKEVLNFHKVPHESKFIHMVGNAKRNILGCEQMTISFKRDFPTFYDQFVSRLPEAINYLNDQ